MLSPVVLKVGALTLCGLKSAATVPARRTILFSHATGFCKEVFIPIVNQLRRQGVEDADLFMFDVRSHGDSGVANDAILAPNSTRRCHPKECALTLHVCLAGNNWWDIGSDLMSIATTLKQGKGPDHELYGVGHSGSGTAMYDIFYELSC